MPATALAAVTDFAFNLGQARLKGSTLRRRLQAGDMAGAAGELRKWTRAGGRVPAGPGAPARGRGGAAESQATRFVKDRATTLDADNTRGGRRTHR